jgi:hypothetical protein
VRWSEGEGLARVKVNQPVKAPTTGVDLSDLYEVTGNVPVTWQMTAHELIAAANICWARWRRTNRLQDLERRTTYHPELTQKPVLMLYAFALEALLKALWVAQGNLLVVDGRFTLETLGGKPHDLHHLCERTKIRLDSKTEQPLVDQLTWAVEHGRYPLGRRRPASPRPLMPGLDQTRGQLIALLARVNLEIHRQSEFVFGSVLRATELGNLGIRRIGYTKNGTVRSLRRS